jgi:hypothetical protein
MYKANRDQEDRMATDDDATVRRLLAAVGILPPDDEVDAMVQMYPALRASADALYTPEASRFLPAYSATDAELSSSNLEAK